MSKGSDWQGYIWALWALSVALSLATGSWFGERRVDYLLHPWPECLWWGLAWLAVGGIAVAFTRFGVIGKVRLFLLTAAVQSSLALIGYTLTKWASWWAAWPGGFGNGG
jgi:hypothetical protein